MPSRSRCRSHLHQEPRCARHLPRAQDARGRHPVAQNRDIWVLRGARLREYICIDNSPIRPRRAKGLIYYGFRCTAIQTDRLGPVSGASRIDLGRAGVNAPTQLPRQVADRITFRTLEIRQVRQPSKNPELHGCRGDRSPALSVTAYTGRRCAAGVLCCRINQAIEKGRPRA